MASELIRTAGDADFKQIISGERPVLVDFYTTWCGPCKAMEPVVDRIAQRFAGSLDVVKVDIEQSPEVAAEHAVRAVPTFALFVGGKQVERVMGSGTEARLASLVEPHLAPAEAGRQG